MRKNVFALFILMVSLFSFVRGKTIRADVTNDNVDDIIRMGMKIVTVQDGVSGKLHTIVVGEEFLADISVDDYFSGTEGNELAILTFPDEVFLTDVYGYRNKRFVRLAEMLPGELTFDEELRLFGYAAHEWDQYEVLIYWPIVEREGYLRAAPLAQSSETALVVEKNKTTEFQIDLLSGTLTVVVVSTFDGYVIVFMLDDDGTLIKQTRIDSRVGFYGRIIAESAKTVSLNIDNSQSNKVKAVRVTVKQYQYP
ncbi:MAG: hypothetical protein JSV98_04195 [candidate division WOR-3 bacterium]|nr:MAG: hypothetical protein JSV98_04195 [candidate division WOR-3 bacterium]